MKVLKLSVDYDGWYGGDVHEYSLLPTEWNGLYTEKLELGEHNRAIYLGEIEGKHSEVYGDLTVEVIDLSTLTPIGLNDLINNANNSEFECTFEGWEDDFKNEYEDDEEKWEEILVKQTEFENEFGVTFNSEYEIKTMTISDKLIQNIKDNTTKLASITVKVSDLEEVLSVLKEREIEVF